MKHMVSDLSNHTPFFNRLVSNGLERNCGYIKKREINRKDYGVN